jgi:FkbH-like protein
MISSENYFTFTFNLKDKFGDHGLICVIILNKQINSTLFIDTWFMSCRVLKRGMERFVLNHLVSYAKNNNFKYLEGEYIETPKNKLVKDHYSGLGFEKKYNNWILNLSDCSKLETYIK